jgi:pimeloyl-ACP methyl ester carboxylesterase
LLDPENRRRVAGTQAECREEFVRLRQIGMIPPLSGRAVITLHGFGRSRDHMQPLGRYLREKGDLTWINVTYSSTRGSLDDHAATLAQVIDGLDGIEAIDLVGHSLGNLVVRRYLGEGQADEPSWQVDPRLRRMVMLGPPNNGARVATLIADLVSDSELARFITGPSAWQLARQWDDTHKLLATPDFEFGVIAGGAGDERGFNPLLPGDDDFIVRVEETRLVGACDFRCVGCRHGSLMRDPDVQRYVLSFLDTGCFTSFEDRQPIEAR